MTPTERAKLKQLAATLLAGLHDLPPTTRASAIYRVYDDLLVMVDTPASAQHLWFLGVGQYPADAPSSSWGGRSYPPPQGENKIGAIRAIRDLLGLGLHASKQIVESAPCDLGPFDPSRSIVQQIIQEHKCEWRDAEY